MHGAAGFRMEANLESPEIFILPYGQQGPPTIGCKKTKKKMTGCQYGKDEFIPSAVIEGKALDVGRPQTLSTKR